MPRTAPTEDATFPVYRVQAECSKCGKKGWTKAFKHYPKGTVIQTLCSLCIGSWEASVKQLEQPLRAVVRNRKKRDEPEHKPREHKPHWTDI